MPVLSLQNLAGSLAYEPDEHPKRKHYWNRDEADFVTLESGAIVGKCPVSISAQPEEALRLLRRGFGWNPRGWTKPHPQRIYTFDDDGIVYRATPTNPGRSYHGFPERRELFPADRGLKVALLVAAKEHGLSDEAVERLSQWLGA
ncbi:MAG: hypothetical protein IPN34_19165 [Planctomycetes bacterium]|nr:hypothetical protein [Planctomycetota bacterium]